MEYVPEKAELDDSLPEEFRKVFEKFSFSETAASEVEGALNNCPTVYVVFYFGFCLVNEYLIVSTYISRKLIKKMRLLQMQHQTRRLTQIQKRKKKMLNKKRKASRIRRRRSLFQLLMLTL